MKLVKEGFDIEGLNVLDFSFAESFFQTSERVLIILLRRWRNLVLVMLKPYVGPF